jgi:hypothetical protein
MNERKERVVKKRQSAYNKHSPRSFSRDKNFSSLSARISHPHLIMSQLTALLSGILFLTTLSKCSKLSYRHKLLPSRVLLPPGVSTSSSPSSSCPPDLLCFPTKRLQVRARTRERVTRRRRRKKVWES